MDKKVLIVDTCLACVWMQVPGMETAGPDNDRWDRNRVNKKIEEETAAGTLLVLPLASIIETGNHIAQIKRQNRMDYVRQFAEHIQHCIDGDTPWVAYNEQNSLWEGEHLKGIADRWVEMNDKGETHSLGDVSILDVATAYRKAGFKAEILTADQLLKAYESVDIDQMKMPTPRRKR
jgi:hypothetical protein